GGGGWSGRGCGDFAESGTGCAGGSVARGDGRGEDQRGAGLSVGAAGGGSVAGHCAEGTEPRGSADSVCADRLDGGHDDLAACRRAAQLGAGAAGKRLRQRVAGADSASGWRTVPGSGEEAVSNCSEGRASESGGGSVGQLGARYAAGVSAVAMVDFCASQRVLNRHIHRTNLTEPSSALLLFLPLLFF